MLFFLGTMVCSKFNSTQFNRRGQKADTSPLCLHGRSGRSWSPGLALAARTYHLLGTAGQHHAGQGDADGQLAGLHGAERDADRQAGDGFPTAGVGALLQTLQT